MKQTIFPWQDRNERTEINDTCNGTGIHRTHFRLCRNRHNHFHSGIARGLILAKDLDRAVIINIDGSTRIFSNLTDGRAALTDNVPNLVLIDFQRHHARRIFRRDLTR